MSDDGVVTEGARRTGVGPMGTKESSSETHHCLKGKPVESWSVVHYQLMKSRACLIGAAGVGERCDL